MTVLDAFAVLALLKDEAAADEVTDLLSGEARLTAVGVTEVVDHLVRIVGADEEDVMLDLAALRLLHAVPIDPAIGAGAGRLRARWYNRRTCVVSLADCVAAEVARQRGEELATADPHLLALCEAEGIPTHVLPDSRGHRWSPDES